MLEAIFAFIFLKIFLKVVGFACIEWICIRCIDPYIDTWADKSVSVICGPICRYIDRRTSQ